MRTYTPGYLISLATTNGLNIKATTGSIGYLIVTNRNAAVRYLKLYDKAITPVVGTDVAAGLLVHIFEIPGSTTGAGIAIPLPETGIHFANGIGFGITTGSAANDTGAVAAGEIILNYGWR